MPMYVKRWVLVMAGVAAGHQLAHSFTHSHMNDAAHGYLTVAMLILVPAAAITLLNLAWTEAMTGVRGVKVTDLLIAQSIVFVAQELAEALAMGSAPLSAISDPILWLGLAAQALVAGVTFTFVVAGRSLLERVAIPATSVVSAALKGPVIQLRSVSIRSGFITALPIPRAPPLPA